VKDELKLFDSNFHAVFGSVPTKKQKEPLRPLYVYYKKIRGVLLPQTSTNRSSTSTPSSRILASQSKTWNTTSHDHDADSTQVKPRLMEGSKQLTQSSDGPTDNQSRGRMNCADLLAGVDEAAIMERGGELAEDIIRLHRLLEMKQQTTQKLQAYQDYFFKTYGRRIIFHKDIVPMEGAYKRYKQLREQVLKLSESIRRRARATD